LLRETWRSREQDRAAKNNDPFHAAKPKKISAL
jgi:hypothetical protein